MNKFEMKLNELENNIKCFYYLIPEYIDGKYDNKEEVLIPLNEHIKTCKKCKDEIVDYKNYKAKNIEDDILDNNTLEEFKKKFSKIKKKEVPKVIKEGQVWGMPGFPKYITYQKKLNNNVLPYSLEPRPLLIYKIDESKKIYGFPVNLKYLQFASDFDLIISKKESELNLEYMIEVWNPVTTSAELLGKNYWGSVSDEIMENLETLTLEFNGFEVKEDRTKIMTGDPIKLENDLRKEFQEIEKKATEVMSAPYVELREYEEYMINLRSTLFASASVLVLNEFIIKKNQKLQSLAASSGKKNISNAILINENIDNVIKEGILNIDDTNSEGFLVENSVFRPILSENFEQQTIQWDIPENITVKGGEQVYLFDCINNELIGIGIVITDESDKIISVSDIFIDSLKRNIENISEITIIIESIQHVN